MESVKSKLIDTEVEEEDVGTELDDNYSDGLGNLSEAIIASSDWTIETIYRQVIKGNIDLNPEFQRRDLWPNNKKSALIESVFLRVPIPQILLAEKEEQRGKFIVLDGKQRLLALTQFMNGYYKEGSKILRISGLNVLEDLNKKTANDIFGADSQRDISEFENETIRTVFIRNWPTKSYLYTVFNRLNTNSTPLSPQELRVSLFPGDFTNFVLEKSATKQVLSILNLREADKRMRDVELLIRYYSFKFFADQYKGKLQIFFDECVENCNNDWINNNQKIKLEFENLIKTIEFIQRIYGELAFIKPNSQKKQFTRLLFDLKMYFFSDEILRKKIDEKASLDANFLNEIIIKYKELFHDSNDKFVESITAHTSDLDKTYLRFEFFSNYLSDLLDGEINIANPIIWSNSSESR